MYFCIFVIFYQYEFAKIRKLTILYSKMFHRHQTEILTSEFSLTIFFPLFVCLCLSICLYLTPTLYLCLSICLYLTPTLYLCPSICLYLTPTLYLCLPVCLYLTPTLYLCLFICLYLTPALSISVSYLLPVWIVLNNACEQSSSCTLLTNTILNCELFRVRIKKTHFLFLTKNYNFLFFYTSTSVI